MALPGFCIKCKCFKSLESFSPSKGHKSGHKPYCRDCINKESKDRRAKGDQSDNKRNRAYANRKRKEVIFNLGNKCAVCGESKYEFLSIDHVNNNGAQERLELTGYKRGGNNIKVLNYIIAQNFPKHKYQVLCFNCHYSKTFSGYNPKQIEKETISLTEGYLGEGI